MEYVPDAWVVVKIHSAQSNETIYKVLAGWYGGYLSGDSWKMNSGITHYTYDDEYWYFHGYSGSVYKCRMDSERFINYTESVFKSFKNQLESLNDGSSIEVVRSYENME